MKRNEERESILLWSRQTVTGKLISRKSVGSVKSCGIKNQVGAVERLGMVRAANSLGGQRDLWRRRRLSWLLKEWPRGRN